MDREELLRTITTAQRELAQLAERISDDRLRDPAMGDWKGKDVLAHLAWWHDHSVLVIEGLRAGRQPYDETDLANTTDGFNERAYREHLDDRRIDEHLRAEFQTPTGSLTRMELASDHPLQMSEIAATSTRQTSRSRLSAS